MAKDLPIGSGEIESAHRYIAQQRLKRPGASWRVKHAEYMLALRITPQKRRLGSLLGHGRQTPLPRKGRKSEPANRITTNSSVIAPHWIAPASLHPYVARLQPLAQRRHDRDFIGPAVDRAGFDELAPYRSEEGRRRMSRKVAPRPRPSRWSPSRQRSRSSWAVSPSLGMISDYGSFAHHGKAPICRRLFRPASTIQRWGQLWTPIGGNPHAGSQVAARRLSRGSAILRHRADWHKSTLGNCDASPIPPRS